jgi:zinc transport system substrate-binding protein
MVGVGLLVVIGTGACRQESLPARSEAGEPILVYASIPPVKYFAERIGGSHVRVDVLLKPGQSMHTYEPTARQMVELSSARLFLRIGVPFEKQVADKVGQALKNLELVDVNEGITLLTASEPCEHDADHGHHHDHRESELDMHTWTSPRLAKIQAGNICRALVRVDPDRRADYEANLAALKADLDHLDVEIAAALRPLKGRTFFVFHPAFGYFAEAYGLKQVAIESGGKEPSAKQLDELIDRARDSGVKLIFVQPQFPRRGAEAVAQAIGGAVVPLDHLAEDYVGNLRHVAEMIRAALAVATQPATGPA